MKKNLMLIVLSFLALQGFGQSETLFNRARVVGAFGAPITEFSQFKGDCIVSYGGGGGLIIDDFFIGGYGMGAGDIASFMEDDEKIELEMAHGGFWLGYTFRSYKLVHIFASTKLGWGGIDIEIDDNGYRNDDNIFVVTPELGLELNVFSWFKIAATAGYRSVSGVNTIKGQTNKDFSGMSGSLTFRFGGFGDWKRSRGNQNEKNGFDD